MLPVCVVLTQALKVLATRYARQHGARDYPNECCGMLLGTAEGSEKHVSEAVHKLAHSAIAIGDALRFANKGFSALGHLKIR